MTSSTPPGSSSAYFEFWFARQNDHLEALQPSVKSSSTYLQPSRFQHEFQHRKRSFTRNHGDLPTATYRTKEHRT